MKGQLQLQWRSTHTEDAKIVGQPLRLAAAMGWSQPEPMREVMCAVNSKVREVELPKSCGAQKVLTESQVRGIEVHDFINTIRCWFCFALIVTVPWFVLRIRCIYYYFIRTLGQLRDLGFFFLKTE